MPHKNGAPYGMACALPARLSGAQEERVTQWQDFGTALGLLGQLRNDQEDLVTGRDEDARNQTATYLSGGFTQWFSRPWIQSDVMASTSVPCHASWTRRQNRCLRCEAQTPLRCNDIDNCPTGPRGDDKWRKWFWLTRKAPPGE